MSKITLAPSSSGTATFTIESPATNTDRTMGLPDSAGDLVVTQAAQTLTNKTFSGAQVFGTASLDQPTGNAPLYAARAWVNFNGSGTVAIRASGNVSSITDNGVGIYTVNFTTAMEDANFSVVASANNTADGNGINTTVAAFASSTGTASIKTVAATTGGLFDAFYISAAIFR